MLSAEWTYISRNNISGHIVRFKFCSYFVDFFFFGRGKEVEIIEHYNYNNSREWMVERNFDDNQQSYVHWRYTQCSIVLNYLQTTTDRWELSVELRLDRSACGGRLTTRTLNAGELTENHVGVYSLDARRIYRGEL